MRIEGPRVGIGLTLIMLGLLLQVLFFLGRTPYFAAGAWAMIAYGLYLVLAQSEVVKAGTPRRVEWVAFDDVPDSWEGRMVWHHVEAHPGRKQLPPTTCMFSRLRFPKDEDDGTGVYFALVDMPEPPRKKDTA